MSRSYKKPIVKDKTGRWYNKLFRRINKQEVRDIKNLQDMEDYHISHPNEIVDKWDISDWWFYIDNKLEGIFGKKATRK